MVKGVGVPGRRPRTHAPVGWPGPVDFPLDPSRGRRNGLTLAVFTGLGIIAYFALGGGQVLGWGLALIVLALSAGSSVRVQGDPSQIRLTREGIEYLGTRPPKRIRWVDIQDIALVDLPRGPWFGKKAKDGNQVIRLTCKPARAHAPRPHAPSPQEVLPTGHEADVNALAWAIEGWWRYATRPW
jgi:hypothetical protein